MTPVRLAVVGFGRWGRNYVSAARDSGEAQVVKVFARGHVERDGFEVVPSSDLLANADALDDVDALVVAGHPLASPTLCEAALGRGKPVLVEKPAALSLAGAERIARAEERSTVFALIGHQHLFAAQYEALREERGVVERAVAVSCGPASRDYPVMWDYGPHAVSMLLGLGFMPDGGNWSASHAQRKGVSVTAYRRDGSFGLYDGYAPAEPALTREVRAFAHAVRRGWTNDWRFGARWAVDVAKVLEANTPHPISGR